MFKISKKITISVSVIIVLAIVGGSIYFGIYQYTTYQDKKAQVAYQKCLDKVNILTHKERLSDNKGTSTIDKLLYDTIVDKNKYIDEWKSEGNPNYDNKSENKDLAFMVWMTDKYPEFCKEYNTETIKSFTTKQAIVWNLPHTPPLAVNNQTDNSQKEQDEMDKLKQEVNTLKNQQAQQPKAQPSTTENSASEYLKAIVMIICSDGKNAIRGSGIIVGNNRWVITNAHVIEGMTACKVGLTDDPTASPSRWFDVTVQGNLSSKVDLAFLEPVQTIPADVPTILNICSSSDIKIGDNIAVIGYPAIGGYTITATEGVVSGFEGYMVKTSAKIEHGNSGGGAFLLKSNCLFGVPTLVQQGTLESLGYIINYSAVSGR